MQIPIAIPDLSGNEQKYVQEAIESTWISSTGKFVSRFEENFAYACKVRYAFAVANGTVALHLALLALGVGPGDEVIIPSLTYIATANVVKYVGAEPVFVDVDPHTWCIDPSEVEAAVTDRTRAIIAVHLYGNVCDMDSLWVIAERHRLWLVEDAAEAPFASFGGVNTGNLGDIATFSFYGNKVITCGEGGSITTNRDHLAARIRQLRGQGSDPERRYFFPVIGYNYRLTNVACAILCAQLERHDAILSERCRVMRRYQNNLKLISPSVQEIDFRVVPSPWLFSMMVDDRDSLARKLATAGVETRPFFVPIHMLPPYAECRRGSMQFTDKIANAGLNLPTYPALKNDDIDKICDIIKGQ